MSPQDTPGRNNYVKWVTKSPLVLRAEEAFASPKKQNRTKENKTNPYCKSLKKK